MDTPKIPVLFSEVFYGCFAYVSCTPFLLHFPISSYTFFGLLSLLRLPPSSPSLPPLIVPLPSPDQGPPVWTSLTLPPTRRTILFLGTPPFTFTPRECYIWNVYQALASTLLVAAVDWILVLRSTSRLFLSFSSLLSFPGLLRQEGPHFVRSPCRADDAPGDEVYSLTLAPHSTRPLPA